MQLMQLTQFLEYDYDYNQYAGAAYNGITNAISIISSIVGIIALFFLFSKAGQEGWKAIIPIYNGYVLYDILYGAGWKFFLLLVPGLNVVMLFLLPFRMAQAYGKGIGFGFLLFFFPHIMQLYMAFSKDVTYYGPCASFI